MQKCIVICRVSTSTQSMGASLDAQESYLNNYAKQHNYSVKDTLKEIGSVWQGRKSSKILKKFVDIFEKARNTIFLLLDVSRLCRCEKTGKRILKSIKRNKNKIIFVSQELVVPKMKKEFRRQIMYAQMESERISRRVKLSQNYLKRKRLRYRVAPYGKKIIYRNGKKMLRKNKKEWYVIKFIRLCKQSVIYSHALNKLVQKIEKNLQPIECYDKFEKKVDKITECLTYKEIADLLNSLNIRYRSKKWNKGNVSRVYRSSLRYFR